MKKLMLNLIFVILSFFLTVYVSAPCILKTYNLLIFETTQYTLNLSTIIGVWLIVKVMTFSFKRIDFKLEKEDDSYKSEFYFSSLILYPILCLVTVGMAYLYKIYL